MNVLWHAAGLLPGPLRRKARVATIKPDPRDSEYASVLRDDGTLDPAWREAHTRRWPTDPSLPVGCTALPFFPRVLTDGDIELLRRDGFSAEMLDVAARRIPYDQARYPQLFARKAEVAALRAA